jgi:hypothetical protein
MPYNQEVKKTLPIALAIFVFVVPFVVLAQSAAGTPLVPQSSAGNSWYLNLCDLRTLANNIITFAVYLSVFVATLMFAYGGILYVAGSANEGNIKKAHSVFTKTLAGLVIVLIAWLIVNIVLSVLTGQSISDWTDWFGTGNSCSQIATNPVAAPTPAGAGVTGGTKPPTGYSASGAAQYATQHAAAGSTDQCALYVRTALANGGGLTDCNTDHPVDAYQYATTGCLVKAGFPQVTYNSSYTPQSGDVAVFPQVAGHSAGHIEIYNGSTWVSDFVQQGFYPATAYQGSTPTIFRTGI